MIAQRMRNCSPLREELARNRGPGEGRRGKFEIQKRRREEIFPGFCLEKLASFPDDHLLSTNLSIVSRQISGNITDMFWHEPTPDKTLRCFAAFDSSRLIVPVATTDARVWDIVRDFPGWFWRMLRALYKTKYREVSVGGITGLFAFLSRHDFSNRSRKNITKFALDNLKIIQMIKWIETTNHILMSCDLFRIWCSERERERKEIIYCK